MPLSLTHPQHPPQVGLHEHPEELRHLHQEVFLQAWADAPLAEGEGDGGYYIA